MAVVLDPGGRVVVARAKDLRSRRQMAADHDPALLRHLLVGDDSASRVTPNGLLFAGWIIGSIAVAGPVWQRRPSPFADTPPTVVAVLKVATSMTATDLAPTRLDRARQKLSDLLALREGAATGLIAYAGSTHSCCRRQRTAMS